MTICAIVGCSNGSGAGVSMFGLPAIIKNQCKKTQELSERRRTEWLSRINRDLKGRKRPLNCRSIKVCSRHFINGKPSYLFDFTNPDWAPSLHLGYNDRKQAQKQNVGRYARAKARRSKMTVTLQPASSTDITADVEVYSSSSQDFPSNELPNLDSVTQHYGVEQENEPESDSLEPVTNNGGQLSPCSHSCHNVDEVDVGEVLKHVACQTDLQNQELKELRAKFEDLMKNNILLCAQNSTLSEQVNSLTIMNEQLQSDRDMLHNENVCLRNEVEQLKHNLKQVSLDETSFNKQLQSERDMLHNDNLCLRNEVEKLKHILKQVSLDETSLEGDDDKTKFYTGIPSFDLLKIVYDFVECEVPHSHRNSLPKFSEFLLTMMRLRLGHLELDLAYRFNISQSTVSSICLRWFKVMSARLSSIITWPERDVLQRTIPKSFKDVFGVRFTVIIDCFEIFINRPTSLSTRAETWSNYKHHNTVKFLIGITPQGTVCFISNAWGGRASDKHITLQSGFLEKLLPGDVVLADRGFNIDEDVGMRQAKIAIPAFTKGKTQLSFDDIQKTREIANVRIHVERVIGFIKRKFRILGGVFPYSYLSSSATDDVPPIDQILTICCGLINLCPSLIREQVSEGSTCVTGEDLVQRLVFSDDIVSHELVE